MNLEIMIKEPQWSTVALDKLAKSAFGLALSSVNLINDNYEVSFLACNDNYIIELNKKFRSQASATNVLAWPSFVLMPAVPGHFPKLPPHTNSADDTIFLGDIAISYETCFLEAKVFNRPVESHIVHLLLHSCLHLLGFNHESDDDAKLMERLEINSLAKLGISNPYLEYKQ